MQRATFLLFAITLLAGMGCAADRKAVFPPGAKPIGPFSPGVISGNWLYVSGQGARNAEGKLGADMIENIHQSLDNVRAVVEAAGMRMDHVLYVQVYLSNMSAYEDVDAIFRNYFPHAPARTVTSVVRMPTDTPVEISAIAYNGPRDSIRMGGFHPAAVQAGGRTYFAGVLGRRSDTARLPDSGVKQTELAFESLAAVMKNAKVGWGDLSVATIYFSPNVRAEDVDTVARQRLKSTPYLLIETAGIPLKANIEIMATAAPDLEFTRLMDLSAAGDALKRAVVANVYADTIEHFADMNKVYAGMLGDVAPARTTLQTTPFSEGKQHKVSAILPK